MKNWMEKPFLSPLRRRTFMKWGAAVGGVTAAGGLPFKAVANTPSSTDSPKDKNTYWSACLVNCGSRCALRVHTEDGVITQIETDNRGDDSEFGQHQIRACLRGRSIKHRVYNPDRLKYPMKRVGKRGEGRFERISWDEAMDLMADKLKYTIQNYGNDAIHITYGSGTQGIRTDGKDCFKRLMNLTGGFLDYYGNYSWGQIQFALPFTYGTKKAAAYGSYTSEIENSELLVMFGYNPAETRMSGGGEIHEHVNAQRKNKIRTIIIDPRYTDTMLGKEDQWIPIRPGTDAALVEGIAHVLITENLVDQPFLDAYCQGYDEKTLPSSAPQNGHYKAHILGTGPDSTAKTPSWASKITGIPEKQIIQLAREIGNTKPCFITQGTGIQRQSNGEQTSRAIVMLPILTGNIGLPGTNTGDMPANYGYPAPRLPVGSNPITTRVTFFNWVEAIYKHETMTDKTAGLLGGEKLNNPIKFIISCASNVLMNQHAELKRQAEIIGDESLCEFIVVCDNHMTASARYADLLLPDVTNLENTEVSSDGYSSGSMAALFPLERAVKPLYETKSVYEMCSELSKRFDLYDEFTEGRTHDQWLEYLYAERMKKDPNIPSLKALREQGPYQIVAPKEGRIALEDFRNDPVANPVGTPSGRIEIYSTKLETIAKEWELIEGDVVTPLPQYTVTWDSHLDPRAKDYPLQICGYHTKGRTHSTYHNIPWLREVVFDGLWMNPIDAEKRGLSSGDSIKVWNDRGELRMAVKVTPRIMPGVAALGQGAWYSPDKNGVDHGGCVNSLTSQRSTALSKGNGQHSILVEVAKA
ncbi:dimethyl sulfoxide reductase subunit A [Vibrio splendidus]|uniref:Dimethyl sulfoxide reductase subunit A n=1 Tax=Vibrio splendidus TaxID=29497 RepID=A0A2N7F5G0_VIBSP|nr:DMSO/selenate family reductase complex A subunit [Vibrio splendidus]PMI72385.1 dimethyl sulfoxide reductase subunit A [Vibrio splendidus]PMJ60896.1 dimethyl sulfoxide reductase subunit A [Vibrio splendidus]PMK51680.1 dimethyl sulfoxide reductase subunit A [Vibrio splendidus]